MTLMVWVSIIKKIEVISAIFGKKISVKFTIFDEILKFLFF